MAISILAIRIFPTSVILANDGLVIYLLSGLFVCDVSDRVRGRIQKVN
jgi:hypothetical protein